MTGGAPAPIDVMIDDPEWDRHGADWQTLAAGLYAQALSATGERGGAVAVLLSGDDRLQELNREFRDKDKPTNVLSFPAPRGYGEPDGGVLGDIAIAAQTCAREADAQGKAFHDHAAHLILHGLLHLLGLDHEAGEDQARRMEAIEREILAGIGVADPYAAPPGVGEQPVEEHA